MFQHIPANRIFERTSQHEILSRRQDKLDANMKDSNESDVLSLYIPNHNSGIYVFVAWWGQTAFLLDGPSDISNPLLCGSLCIELSSLTDDLLYGNSEMSDMVLYDALVNLFLIYNAGKYNRYISVWLFVDGSNWDRDSQPIHHAKRYCLDRRYSPKYAATQCGIQQNKNCVSLRWMGNGRTSDHTNHTRYLPYCTDGDCAPFDVYFSILIHIFDCKTSCLVFQHGFAVEQQFFHIDYKALPDCYNVQHLGIVYHNTFAWHDSVVAETSLHIAHKDVGNSCVALYWHKRLSKNAHLYLFVLLQISCNIRKASYSNYSIRHR